MKREAFTRLLLKLCVTIGFYGFNSGANNTYGYLNDPGLGAYVEVATGASASPYGQLKLF